MDGSAILILRAPSDSADAQALMRELDDELRRRYPLDPIHGLRPEEASDPGLTFLVARVDDQCAGCGALRAIEPGVGEIKRMFVRSRLRRRGVARRLLSALEAEARARGDVALRLETGIRQRAAIELYRSAGYRRIPPFGEYVDSPSSVCFEKRL